MPFTVAHTYIAHIWQYPPPPGPWACIFQSIWFFLGGGYFGVEFCFPKCFGMDVESAKFLLYIHIYKYRYMHGKTYAAHKHYLLSNKHQVCEHTLAILCSSRKYPYSLHRRDWNFLGGEGCKAKKFKEMYEAQLEFPEGCGS